MYREVPIDPRLAGLLTEAKDGRRMVGDGVSVCGLSRNNLHKRAEAYCNAAGVIKWPKFFQAMRSSCENDWKVQGIAEATYTAWIGHTAIVSPSSTSPRRMLNSIWLLGWPRTLVADVESRP